MSEVSKDEAIRFLEVATRNWDAVQFDKHALEDVRVELQEFVARRATPQPAEARGMVEAETLATAVFHALYGEKADPFQNPESYDFCEKVAAAALSATLSPQAGGGEGWLADSFKQSGRSYDQVPVSTQSRSSVGVPPPADNAGLVEALSGLVDCLYDVGGFPRIEALKGTNLDAAYDKANSALRANGAEK